MNKKIVFFLTAMFAFVIFSGVYYNKFTVMVNTIKAQHDTNKQEYSSLLIQIESSNLVADQKYGELILKAIAASNVSRYGEDGVQASMLWITENFPNISDETYQKLLQLIEINYNKISNNQNAMILLVNNFRNETTTLPGIIFAKIFNFSQEDIEEYSTILFSDTAVEDYKKGRMSAPKLN